MKTQNTKLDFSKSSVLELNDQEMLNIETAGATITFHWSRDKETHVELDVTIYW